MANAFNIDKGGSTTSDTHLINETFHVFSKSPGSPTTSLGGARLKSGHTTTTSDVWADEIPAFFKAATQAKFDLFSTKAVKDDLCLFNGNVYQHNGTEFVSLGTEAEVLVDGATFKKNDKDVIKFHKGRTAINLTADNNNGDGSNNYTAKIYDAATGSTTFVPQFISAMDKMVDGIPSLAYDAAVFAGGSQLAEGLTADNDYICNAYAGVIQFNKARSSGVTVNAWEYIGDKLTTSISSIRQSIKDISDVTLKGVVASVTADENTAQKAGITVDNTVSTTPVIKFTGGSVTTDETKLVSGGAVKAYVDTTALAEGGSIAKAIADAKGEVMNAINAIQHFNVKIVDALPESAAELVENTIYLVPEEDKTSGNYVEYIAYKPEGSETVTTERIGTTAVDLEGYTTDEEYAALAGETGRVTVLEGKVTTLTGSGDGSVAKALADAKDYTDTAIATELAEGGSIAQAIAEAKEQAIANAKVTLTAGTGITIPNSGEQDTAFTVSVDTEVIATKASVEEVSATVTGVSQTVASLETTLSAGISEAKSAASAAQSTADEAKATADTAVQTASGDDYVSAAKEADSTNIKVTTNIDAIASAVDAALVKDGTAVATAIAGAATAGTDAADALADTAITEQSVSGSGISVTLGGKVGAPTLTGSVTTASYADGVWTDGEKVVTGSTVASAIKDVDDKINTLHSTAVTYKVYETKPEASEELKGIIALVPAGEGDSAVAGSYIEWLCVESVAEDGSKSYSWERIGTTAADFTQYAKTADLKVVETTVNGLTYSQTDGLVSASVAKASTTQVGTVQLTATYDSTNSSDAATGKSIAAAIETLDSTKSGNGIKVTQTNGVIESVTEELITASVPEGTTSVEGNVAYVGSTKHVIAPDKFQTAAQMPATLTSWVCDLSNLTNGDNMFNGCTGLTVFVGDLSSLTSGVDMFNGCTLDAESLEILAENLPTVSGGTIDIGVSTNATEEVIATIKGKGWTVKSNGTDI